MQPRGKNLSRNESRGGDPSRTAPQAADRPRRPQALQWFKGDLSPGRHGGGGGRIQDPFSFHILRNTAVWCHSPSLRIVSITCFKHGAPAPGSPRDRHATKQGARSGGGKSHKEQQPGRILQLSGTDKCLFKRGRGWVPPRERQEKHRLALSPARRLPRQHTGGLPRNTPV